jgi:hypothetical protein
MDAEEYRGLLIFPQVMSHRTPRHMNWYQPKKVQEVSKMQVERAPVDRVLTMSTPLWPDNRAMSPLCLARRLSEEDPESQVALVMASTQP